MDYKNINTQLLNILHSEGIGQHQLLEILLASISKKIVKNMHTSMYIDNLVTNVNEIVKGTKTIDEFNKILSNCNNDEIKNLIINATYACQQFGDASSSYELCKLAILLLDIKRGYGFTYCDVGCGMGNFLLALCDFLSHNRNGKLDCPKEIYGIEYNYKIAAIAQTLLDINFPEFNSEGQRLHIINDDVLSDGLEKIIPFQKAFIFSPLGLRIEKSTNSSILPNFQLTPRNSVSVGFIDKTLQRLIGGDLKAVAIVPAATFLLEADKKYIYELIKSGWVEGIIELPIGAIRNIGIKTFLLVLSPNNSKIKLFDASKYSKKINIRNGVLEYEKIYDDYSKSKNIDIDEFLARKKGTENLGESEWIKSLRFEPSQYKLELSSNKRGIQLCELAEVFPGCKYTLSNLKPYIAKVINKDSIKFITSSNITDEGIDWKNLQSIDIDDSKLDKYVIHKNDIIMTTKSSKTKIAIVEEEPKSKTIVTGGMIIIRPDTKKINPIYLSMYLKSDLGQKSIMSIQRGSFIISISYSDVKRLFIPMQPIDKQNELSRKYEYKLANYLEMKKELDLMQESINKVFNFDKEGE